MLGTLYINSITEKEVMVKMATIGKQGFFLVAKGTLPTPLSCSTAAAYRGQRMVGSQAGRRGKTRQ